MILHGPKLQARPLGTAYELQLAALTDYKSSPSYFPIN
jgi:hypothetical protein